MQSGKEEFNSFNHVSVGVAIPEGKARRKKIRFKTRSFGNNELDIQKEITHFEQDNKE